MTYASLNGLSTVEFQAIVDEHSISSDSGRCVRCGTYSCDARAVALLEMRARDALPLRRPGSTQPERIGARQVVVDRG